MTQSAPLAGARAVMSLPIASIAVAERIGFYNAAHSAHLAKCFAAEGQHDPIHVKRNGNAARRKWTLIAGLHRLRAAETVGWSEIDVIQVADASDSPSPCGGWSCRRTWITASAGPSSARCSWSNWRGLKKRLSWPHR